MLKLQNLTVQINNQIILKNLSLQVQPGTVHALMGPNGSGKSTLAYAIMGHPSCQVTTGNLIFRDQDITDLAIDKRARLGIFLAFQYPQAVPGLKVFNFLKAAYEAFGGEDKTVSVLEFKQILDAALVTLGLNPELIERDLNDGFSGGEKKRLEMLQLYLLQPKIAIIDEIDSGLDVDALRVVAQVLQACRDRDPEFTIILVTHYRRILEYLKPDFVHVVANGELVASGGAALSHKIDQNGYGLYL